MRLPLFTVLGVLVAMTTAIRAQETVTVGGVVVPIIQGWQQTTVDGQVVLKPTDVPPGVSCTFTLAGGSVVAGPLQDRLAAEWKGFETVGRIIKDDGGKIDGAGNPVELAGRSGTIETNQKVTLYVWLLLARANGRDEIMIFITSTPEAFAKYGAAVTKMVNAAKYVLPKPAEPLTGVCFGLVQVKTSTRPECWIFLPNGVVYQGFPYGGPAHIDVDLERKHRRSNFGEYRSDGKEVVVTMAGAKTPTRFAESEGAWVATVTRPFEDRRQMGAGTWTNWTDDVVTPLRITRAKDTDGLKLTGTYRLDAIDLKYAPKPIPSIHFTADGSFSEDGAIHEVDAGTPLADGAWKPTAMPAGGGRGKYASARNTLDLTYQDGTKLSLTFLATPAELAKPTPQTIFLGEKALLFVP